LNKKELPERMTLGIEKCIHPFCHKCVHQYILEIIENTLKQLEEGEDVNLRLRCPKIDGENPCFNQEINR
jgi:hypothetical protein